MRNIYKGSAAAIIGVLTGSGPAIGQERPDFSGKWTAQPAAPAPVYGPEISIRHAGPSLAIARRVGEATVWMNHVLDGSEMRMRMPARLCEGDGESVHVAVWDGAAARISLVGSVPPGGGEAIKRDVTWTFRLDAPDTMTVQMAPAPTAARTQARLSQLEWLGGVWVGTAGSSQVEERWTPPAGGSMLAVARSLRGGLMNSFEFLCIVERQGGLVYTAMPNGRQPATDFPLTAIDADSATFENPAHDFPKAIRYTRRPDGTLEAVISGDSTQRSQTFVFRKH